MCGFLMSLLLWRAACPVLHAGAGDQGLMFTAGCAAPHHSLPPSMMMSPGSINSSSLSMVESTGAPACTSMITRLQQQQQQQQQRQPGCT